MALYGSEASHRRALVLSEVAADGAPGLSRVLRRAAKGGSGRGRYTGRLAGARRAAARGAGHPRVPAAVDIEGVRSRRGPQSRAAGGPALAGGPLVAFRGPPQVASRREPPPRAPLPGALPRPLRGQGALAQGGHQVFPWARAARRHRPKGAVAVRIRTTHRQGPAPPPWRTTPLRWSALQGVPCRHEVHTAGTHRPEGQQDRTGNHELRGAGRRARPPTRSWTPPSTPESTSSTRRTSTVRTRARAAPRRSSGPGSPRAAGGATRSSWRPRCTATSRAGWHEQSWPNHDRLSALNIRRAVDAA